MSHDPATLAAVRERIEALVRKVGRTTYAGVALHQLQLEIERMATAENMDTRPAPALTEADVRRIVDERIAEAKAREHPSDIARMERERSTHMSEPPPPATAKPARVEAWQTVTSDGDVILSGKRPGALSPTYLTHFPNVHNAADAEAFEAAVRRVEAWRTHANHMPGMARDRFVADLDALARFLDAPR